MRVSPPPNFKAKITWREETNVIEDTWGTWCNKRLRYNSDIIQILKKERTRITDIFGNPYWLAEFTKRF